MESLEERVVLTVAGDLDLTFGTGGLVTTDFPHLESRSPIVNPVSVAVNDKILVAYWGTGLVDPNYPSVGFSVARYDLDGGLDRSFGVEGKVSVDFELGNVEAMAVMDDGRIVLAGGAGQYNQNRDFAIARLTSDGQLDTSFGVGGKQTINTGSVEEEASSVAILPDGSVIVAGVTVSEYGNDVAVMKLTGDGLLDSSFGTGGIQLVDFNYYDSVREVSTQDDGSIVLAGHTSTGSLDYDFAVARLTSDGQLDSSFGVGGKQTIDLGGQDDLGSMTVLPDGSVIAVGSTQAAGNFDMAVVKLTNTAQLDMSFGNGGTQMMDFGAADGASSVAVLPNGSIVVAGYSDQPTGGASDLAVARLTSVGQLDATFNGNGKQTIDLTSGNDHATSMAIQADGRILVAGTYNNDVFSYHLTQLTTDGQVDSSFGVDGLVAMELIETATFASSDFVRSTDAVAVTADGKIVVVGSSTQGAEGSKVAVARYNADGSLDESFGTGGKVILNLGEKGTGVAVQLDGAIVVCTSDGVARLTSSGQLDTTFNGNGFQDAGFNVSALTLHTDGSLFLAGQASDTLAGGTDFAVIKLDSEGHLDLSFNTTGMQTIDFGINDVATGIVVQPDGNVVVSGYSFISNYFEDEYSTFTYTSNNNVHVARLTASGQLDVSFNGSGQQTIDTGDEEIATGIALQPDGSIVVAGSRYVNTWITHDNGGSLQTELIFTNLNLAVIRLTSEGQLDSSFGTAGEQMIDVWLIDGASSVAIQPDGSLVLAGMMDIMRGVQRSQDFFVARLTKSGQLDTSFDSSFGTTGDARILLGGHYNYPASVALQADGKIVVAGFSDQDFAVARLVGITDTDDDGIEDAIDTLPLTFSDDFSDGTTSGTIAHRGDQNITIVDAPNPADGVRITADFLGGAAPATIDVVGDASTLSLSAGDQVTVTHGSVILDVLAGIVEASFVADGGGTATASLSSGNGLVFKPESFTFIAPATNTEIVQAMFPTESGPTVSVGLVSGNGVLFQPETATFVAPATNTQPLEIISDGTDETVEPGESVSTGNSAPTAAVAGPANGVRGQRRRLILGATDAPADMAAGFTYRIDWDGDGLSDQTVTGPVGTAVDHVFTASGSYLVGVTATDTAGAESPVTTHAFTIGIAQVQVDPLDPSPHILAVGGGMGADKIHIELADDGDDDCHDVAADQLDAYKVKVQDRVEGRFKYRDSFAAPPVITRIVVFGQAGDDDIQVAGDIDVTVEAHGGVGNDRIKGGRGDDLLFGDEGDDLLVGGSGRDLLIGGLNADRLVGNSDDDILIAGTTDFVDSDVALRAIMAEWTSGRTYAKRVANLAGTGSGESFAARLNENWFLSDATVHDDGTRDLLTGDGGRDWFFLNLVLDANDDDARKDKVTDLSAQEFAVDIDFIDSL